MLERPLLVLDLDETLWHGTLDARDELESFAIRPYLREFILDVSAHYELAIWSSATMPWIKTCCELVQIDTGLGLPAMCRFVWDRQSCKPRNVVQYGAYLDYSHETIWTKPVSRLKRRAISRPFTLARILAVDDSPEKWTDCYGNLVRIKPWTGDNTDYELMTLSKYLIAIKDTENFRKLEKRGWRS